MADSKPNIDISLESINGRYDKACEKSNAFHQWGENESPSKYTNCIMNLTYFLGLFSVCISIKIKRPLERRSVCVCWWIAKYFSCSSGSLISSINLSALKCRSSISRNQTKRIELRTLCAPHFQPFFDSADFAVWNVNSENEAKTTRKIGMFPRQHIDLNIWSEQDLYDIFTKCALEHNWIAINFNVSSWNFQPYLYQRLFLSFSNQKESGKIEIRFCDDLIDIECAFSAFHTISMLIRQLCMKTFFRVKADYDWS